MSQTYSVYILLSQKDGKLYVGCTSDIESRLQRHNNGAVYATKNRRPFSLIYQENFSDKGKAFSRERFLKSLWGGRFKKKVLGEYIKTKEVKIVDNLNI